MTRMATQLDDSNPPAGRRKRQLWWRLLAAVVLVYYVFLSAEQAMLARITETLESAYGDDYAIVALHMDGNEHDQPSLRSMLLTAFKYEFSPNYEPQGSGNITGKRNHLIFITTDNRHVYTWHWSFRAFTIERDSIHSDEIANLNPDVARLYQFNPTQQVRRNGLWYIRDNLNHPDISFYSRELSPEAARRLRPNDSDTPPLPCSLDV